MRRAEFYDVPSVQKIVDEEGETLCKRFGHFDVTSLVEMAMLCIVAVNEAGAVVGFAAFHDHPAGMTGVAASDWPDWLHTYFGHGHFNAANVTWLSYFVCDPTVHTEVAENVLRTAFTTMPEVDAVLMALPVDVKPFLPLRDTFDQLEPKVRKCSCMRRWAGQRRAHTMRLPPHLSSPTDSCACYLASGCRGGPLQCEPVPSRSLPRQAAHPQSARRGPRRPRADL